VSRIHRLDVVLKGPLLNVHLGLYKKEIY
jgi:hypothetical protein